MELFVEDVELDLSLLESSKEWILTTIEKEGKQCGELSYIFCSDEYLHRMNVEYLSHDTFTDVITFDYGMGNIISGDIFISVDRVKDNATQFGSSWMDELNRVMVHGVLHLLGYKDKEDSEQEVMKGKEDFYLSLRAWK